MPSLISSVTAFLFCNRSLVVILFASNTNIVSAERKSQNENLEEISETDIEIT